MTRMDTEEQNLFERLFNEEITEQCVEYAIKETSQEFDAVFSRIKFRMKNIDEHWLALRHFQTRDSLTVFRKRQIVRLRGIASLTPKISEAGTLCRPRRAIHQSVHKHPRKIN